MKKHFTTMSEQKRPSNLAKILTVAFAIAIIVLPGKVGAQERTISGTVIDESDRTGIPGLMVLEKGTTNGALTDFDGNYKLSVTEGATLIYSFMGYKTEERTVGALSVIDVRMELDIEELAEVVVIGYGKVEKGDVTGVVNKIDEKEFNKGMLTSPDQLIAGKVAGVQFISNSGEPGGGVDIRIRGGVSLDAGASPLFVVDGVPLQSDGVAGGRNPLNFINPSDIADITILKDASAAAIYGSRGANGVIIITTKSAENGKLQASYDGAYNITNQLNTVDMLSREEFAFAIGRKRPKYLEDLGTADTDWVDEVLQLAQSQNHNLSFGYGQDGTNARVSLNYQDMNGLINTSNQERYAASINVTQKLLKDDLTLSFNSKHSLINNRFAPNVIGGALIFDPTQPIRNADGEFFEWTNALAPTNPVAEIARRYNIGKNVRNLISGTLTYELPFVQGLSFKANYAYDQINGFSQDYRDINRARPLDIGRFSSVEEKRTSNLIEGYLNYNIQTSGIGKLDLIAGYSYQDFLFIQSRNLSNITNSLDSIGIGRPDGFLNDSEFAEISGKLESDGILRDTENRLISFWARANWSVMDKYLLTATVRRDGSTRFNPNNRWGLFPALALGWRVLDEDFAEPLKSTFSDLKFRASWGITGNEGIGDYRYVNSYQPGDDRAQYIFGNDTINTIRPSAVDPNIKWEETTSLNVGLDYGFFNGRLYGSFDAYRKVTNDLLYEVPFAIGLLTGDKALTNIAEIESEGLEFLVNTVPVDKEDFKINISFNASLLRTQINKLDNSNLPDFFGYPDGGISGDVGQTIQILRVGQPLNTFMVFEHIRDENGNPLPDSEDWNGDGLEDNLDIYVDQNGDGLLNDSDLRPYKNSRPFLTYGMTSNVSYKNFDLSFTFRGLAGAYVYDNVESQYAAYNSLGDFAPQNIHTSAFGYDFTERQLRSDIFVKNAPFLRLDNITLGYNLQIAERLRGRVYFTATNLLTITPYNGADPEAGLRGIDNNLYPRGRTFLVGMNISFN